MKEIFSFLSDHPLYIPFLFANIYIIFKVAEKVRNLGDDENNEDPNDDDNDGGIPPEDPILDLPPRVTLPREPELVS